MADSNKIVLDLGSIHLDLYFDDEAQSPASENNSYNPVVQSSFALGVVNFSRATLEKFRSRNERLKVRVVGGLRFDNDISPALAVDALDSIRVFGLIQAQDDVKEALMRTGKIL